MKDMFDELLEGRSSLKQAPVLSGSHGRGM